jgi:membrane fusion protein (multidrug efflux system)
MKKRMLFVVLGLAVLVGALAAVKALQIRAMIEQGKKFVPPPETVTTAPAAVESWDTSLTAVGTLTAVQGVTVAAELAGKVVEIAFEPGAKVARGGLLLRQDTSSEEAQLPGAVAQAELAATSLARDAKLLEGQIISQAQYDASVANRDQTAAAVGTIRAAIAKKTIRAPFGGRLGVRQANLGQMLREGDPIVTLQSLDPIYVNFTLPQQQVGRLRVGLPVRMSCDALPGVTIEGRITTVEPVVDADTRSVLVQATARNPKEELRPGMFVNASVGLPARLQVLAVAATAILYAPYGDSVFVVEPAAGGKGAVLRQQFVRLGERRGDFVAVASGLKGGEQVVSTGVFKLRNGQGVVVDNRLAPRFEKEPAPPNE